MREFGRGHLELQVTTIGHTYVVSNYNLGDIRNECTLDLSLRIESRRTNSFSKYICMKTF